MIHNEFNTGLNSVGVSSDKDLWQFVVQIARNLNRTCEGFHIKHKIYLKTVEFYKNSLTY
jgi:hypothetical protein